MSPIMGARGGLSASAYGLFAATAAAGDFEAIEAYVVGSGGTSSVTLGTGNTIPQTCKHLQVRLFLKGTLADAGIDVFTSINGDTTSSNLLS